MNIVDIICLHCRRYHNLIPSFFKQFGILGWDNILIFKSRGLNSDDDVRVRRQTSSTGLLERIEKSIFNYYFFTVSFNLCQSFQFKII